MKKNLFFTFCFSFIPGAGQMYQNYMKRGLSIMCLAGLSIVLAVMVQSIIFIIPFLIIMAYSFFDTYNIRNTVGTENEKKDDYIFKSVGKDFSLDSLKNNKLIGIALLLIGVYLVFNNIIYSIAYDLDIEWLYAIVRVIRNYLPSLIVAGITIGIGSKMITKE